jgi:single-strand DNA-binding protein
MSVNKVILVGNVGKDPETRYLDENTAITKFSMATSETYKNRNGERVSTTEWHNVVLWRGLAQVAEKYVKKGTQIYIEGRIKTRSYDDAEGNKKYITEIVGDQMQLLSRKPDGSGEGGQSYGGGQSQNSGQAQSGGQTPSGGQAQSGGQTPSGVQTPSSGQAQSGGQAPSDGQAQGEGQAPSTKPADPFDGGDNGPDDLPF